MADIFERNNDDVFVMNMGPGMGARFVAFQDVERMQEVSVTQGRSMFPKWPGTSPVFHHEFGLSDVQRIVETSRKYVHPRERSCATIYQPLPCQ